jgi:outer membrane protein OmpA-like peptidoglycan-associated protein/tetratricopeptide (TPR) repeat protein
MKKIFAKCILAKCILAECILSVLIFLFIGSLAHAQALRMALANKKYEQYHYADAIQMYEAIVSANPDNAEATEKLAHCYRKINDSKNAEKWYAKVVETPKSHPINKLYYAQSLAKNGKYKESQKWYDAYAQAAKTDPRGSKFAMTYNDSVMVNFYKDSARYKIQLAEFNSEQADFSPMFFREGIVFCSNRKDGSIRQVKHTFQWNKTEFLDLYYTSGGSGAEKLNQRLNSRYHEGPVTFYPSQDSIIFTRNNYLNGKYKTSKDKTNKLKLYFANTSSENGDWGNIKEFPYNNNEYSVGHPTLSTDGRTLYFVSDMPGGYGGTDIYKSIYNKGKWSKPINLGAEINTKGNEMFPFIDENEDLYFSSDGHAGLGGLDIFVSRNKNGKFTAPQNLGVPLNSSQDDFGYIFDEEKEEGYFTSNREGGVGDDDIYTFKRKTCKFIVVVVNEKTNEIIKNAKVEGIEVETAVNFPAESLNDSVYTFKTKLRTNYDLKAFKEGFEEGNSKLSEEKLLKCLIGGEDISDTIFIPIRPIEVLADNSPQPNREKPRFRYKGNPNVKVIEVTNIYFDFDKYYIRPDAAKELDRVIEIMNQYPTLKIELSSHTDTRATNYYNIRLAQRRSRASYHYLVSRGIDPERLVVNSFGENKLAVDCPDFKDCTEEEHQLNRRTEIVILSY